MLQTIVQRPKRQMGEIRKFVEQLKTNSKKETAWCKEKSWREHNENHEKYRERRSVPTSEDLVKVAKRKPGKNLEKSQLTAVRVKNYIFRMRIRNC